MKTFAFVMAAALIAVGYGGLMGRAVEAAKYEYANPKW